MRKPHDLVVAGVPATLPESTAAVCRSRLLAAASAVADQSDLVDFVLTVGTRTGVSQLLSGGSAQLESPNSGAPERYGAEAPRFSFEHLVLPPNVEADLLAAVDLLTVETLVFDTWGLRAVEPCPKTALNFHGPPGTGKTLAAHALADRLGRKILSASYADIESKYHGDGPKNVKAVFAAAEAQRAVLFIDEADSLLSKRLPNVTQGSEQAINSMRSQLLICLEQFRGTVVFATNFVESYDKAFQSRVRNVQFDLPDERGRAAIWRKHLVSSLPIADDVDADDLGRNSAGLCGRDIKNAVIDAAVRVALERRSAVHRSDLVSAVERLLNARATGGAAETEDRVTAHSRLALESAVATLQVENANE